MQPKLESTSWHRMTFAGRVPGYVMRREENSNRSSFCLATYQFRLPSATSDANSEFGPRLTIESGLSQYSDFHPPGVRLADYMTTTRLISKHCGVYSRLKEAECLYGLKQIG
jgi:hypothetical protein